MSLSVLGGELQTVCKPNRRHSPTPGDTALGEQAGFALSLRSFRHQPASADMGGTRLVMMGSGVRVSPSALLDSRSLFSSGAFAPTGSRGRAGELCKPVQDDFERRAVVWLAHIDARDVLDPASHPVGGLVATRLKLPHSRIRLLIQIDPTTARRDGANMALSIYFTPSGFSPEVYDETVSRLEAAGAGAPEGRLYHAALERDGQIQVFDVWDSQESLEAFVPTVSAIMAELGADPGEPMVSPVRNIIQG
jgi:hypothetical protein